MSSNYETLEVLSDVGHLKLISVREKSTGRELWLRRFVLRSGEGDALHSVLDLVIQAQHPNLESILEAGKDEEGWFAIVEKPQGIPLTEVLKRGPFTVKEFDQLVMQCFAAVAVLHEKRIAHLALRPENIWIDKTDGALKACVGGIGEGQVMQPSGAAQALEAYRCMAPEFWQLEAVGRRTDVYALGCIFYEALAGRPAFTAKTAEEMKHGHLQSSVTPLNVLAPHVQMWVSSWVMALMDGNTAARLRNVKAARSRYELGVHGMSAGAMPMPAPVAGYAPIQSYGYPPTGYTPGYVLTSQVHPGSGSLPVSPAAVQQPQAPAPSAENVPAATSSTKLGSSAVASAPQPLPSPRKPGPVAGTQQDMRPLYIGASALVFLVLSFVFFLSSGKKPSQETNQVNPSAEPAPPPVQAASTAENTPLFSKIQDAVPAASVPQYSRGTPPNVSSLAAWFSSRDSVKTFASPNDTQEIVATPGDKVIHWRDSADSGGKFTLTGDRKNLELFPTLNVVRIEPNGREHPVITFHQSETLGGKTSQGSVKMPFDPSLREKGVTIVQALRCRPVAGVLTRSVRLGTLENQKIATIQVDDKGTLLANLGRQSHYLPPVQADHGRFCIVILVWNADEGWAQLSCRTADGRSFANNRTSQVPEEKETAARVQIGDSSAPLTTSGYKFNGDVLETMIYNRGLKDDERQRVESWISDYYFGSK